MCIRVLYRIEPDLIDANRIAQVFLFICRSSAIGADVLRISCEVFYLFELALFGKCTDMLCMVSAAFFFIHGYLLCMVNY